MLAPDATPIFIHALFRSGSTYLFEAFRRSKSEYWCYYEPFNEALEDLNRVPEDLLTHEIRHQSKLRHRHLEKPYFWEYYQIREDLKGLFQEDFSYAEYFTAPEGLSQPLLVYLQTLLDKARARPVFQLCRSPGKARALAESFQGVHLHLWRNPHDQWWSCKINGYFDGVIQLIYNSKFLPPVLDEVRKSTGIPRFPHTSLAEDFDHSQRHHLGSRDNYLSFYALWLYSFLEVEAVARVSLNIDLLGADPEYRKEKESILQSEGVIGLDFSDAASPFSYFDPSENDFFESVEEEIHQLFTAYGYDPAQLDRARELCALVTDELRQKIFDPLKDGVKFRQYALRLADLLAQVDPNQTTGPKGSDFDQSFEYKLRETRAQLAITARNLERERAAHVKTAKLVYGAPFYKHLYRAIQTLLGHPRYNRTK